MKMQDVIFREYDIRGLVNQDFDNEFAYNLGRAYACFAQERLPKDKPCIAIGYDARISSPEIAASVAKGLADSGFDVCDIGLVTSPMTYFATFAYPQITGAIMITGSHNPPEYNGFKICLGSNSVFGEGIQNLKQVLKSGGFLKGRGNISKLDIRAKYTESFREQFSNLKPIKVVFDCGNGAAGAILAEVLQATGLKSQILFEKPDGKFPNHHPDPTVEKNLKDLKQAVAASGAIAGIGFDGDADRIGVVDHSGHMVLGDELMVLYAREILTKQPGAKIIGDVKCSDRFYDDVSKHGGKPIMWKTGHSLVKEKIKQEKAPFGGELSGHVFFADRNYGYDDAIYAGFRLIEILAKTGKTIPELLGSLPKSFNTPEIRIDTTETKKTSIVEKLKTHFSGRTDVEVNLLDGIRVSYNDGWALARASNTQPVLVMRFEASTAGELSRIRREFESVVSPLL